MSSTPPPPSDPTPDPPALPQSIAARRAAARHARRRTRRLAIAGLVTAMLVVIAAVGLGATHRSGAPPLTTPLSALSRGSAEPQSSRLARGLSPAEQARVNDRILGYTTYVAIGSPRRREVALTFDDGPSPWTPRILSVLRREHALATFFVIGSHVRSYPRYAAALARSGMAIGDHTETHPPMGRLSAAAQALEIDRAAAAMVSAGAPTPLLFRPPFGSFNSDTLAALRARHMVMVLWSADTSDYRQPGALQIRYTAISGARAGAIVLFHDGGGPRAQTLAALPRIIRRLRARGFRLVTVPQLVHDDPPPRGQPPPRDLSGG